MSSQTTTTDGSVHFMDVDPSLPYTIRVYLDDGRTYDYGVESADKAREHAAAIATGGYRHSPTTGSFEHYPAWRVLKVKVLGAFIASRYHDTPSGT